MTSIRERLLTAIAARLTPVIATAGGRFLRQPVYRIPREMSPALAITFEKLNDPSTAFEVVEIAGPPSMCKDIGAETSGAISSL